MCVCAGSLVVSTWQKLILQRGRTSGQQCNRRANTELLKHVCLKNAFLLFTSCSSFYNLILFFVWLEFWVSLPTWYLIHSHSLFYLLAKSCFFFLPFAFRLVKLLCLFSSSLPLCGTFQKWYFYPWALTCIVLPVKNDTSDLRPKRSHSYFIFSDGNVVGTFCEYV